MVKIIHLHDDTVCIVPCFVSAPALVLVAEFLPRELSLAHELCQVLELPAFAYHDVSRDASDDAARSKGGSWRMPTSNEIQELIDNCTWTWTTLNDVNGYEVRSKKNDGSIFIPAAGDMAGTTLDTEGRRCCIWSSGLFQGNCATAESLVADKGKVEVSNFARCYGLSIRPVYVYDK